MFKKETLAIVPIASFSVGYAFLFGLLNPLGLGALSTLTYVDVINAMIANLFLIVPAVLIGVGFMNSGIKLEEFKKPRVYITLAILTVLALIELIYSAYYLFTTVWAIIFISSVAKFIFDLSENPMNVVVIFIIFIMSICSFVVGSNRIQFVSDRENGPTAVLVETNTELKLVYQLDKNVLVIDEEKDKLRLIPRTKLESTDFAMKVAQ